MSVAPTLHERPQLPELSYSTRQTQDQITIWAIAAAVSAIFIIIFAIVIGTCGAALPAAALFITQVILGLASGVFVGSVINVMKLSCCNF